MVKKFASLLLSLLLILSVTITPANVLSVSAITVDKTYYTERGTTERFTSATADDFAAKALELKVAGYEEYSTNVITMNAKSDSLGEENLFAVYLNGEKTELKHIAFNPQTKALHVTTQLLNAKDALAVQSAPEYNEVCEPLFVQIMPDETNLSGGTSGMAYALRLRDGRFIMIDGGMEKAGQTYQAENLYNTLNKYNVLDKITVVAWIFTHAHSDHITAFTSFVNKYSNVVIEQLIYNYPADSDILKDPDMAEEQALSEGGIIFEQRKAIAEKLPNVKISTPYGGDVYKFSGVELEFYLTPADMFPVMCYQGNEFNTSSLIFKIKTEGQEILITGDSSDYALVNVALPRFGTALSSDMVQMVHHGITFASGEFYELIGAETAFWPIISGRVKTIVKQEQNMGLINAPSTKEIILSSLGTRAIGLPYTPTDKDGLFTDLDGNLVDDTIYDKEQVSKYGDILNEDITPWARSGNAYPLNNGGSYMTWGSIKKQTSVVNGSDKAIYFNANSATLYTPLNGLKSNTNYTLSFDYMAASTTKPTNGIFSKFGITGMNEESTNFSYNIYQGKSITVNPDEVYGSDNGWNHIDVSFVTPATDYDEYYLSFFATVGSVSGSYKGYIDNISIVESKREYYYHENTYEDLTNDAEWLKAGVNLTLSATNTEGEAINGTSLKITSEHSNYVGTAITMASVPAKTKARVRFNYKVLKGVKGWGQVGYIGYNVNTKTFNWANINQKSYTVAPIELPKLAASTDLKTFTGTIEKTDTKSGLMGFFWKNTEDTTIIVDNLKIAEIIGSVTAVSADESGGTATIKNKLGTKYTDFAANETAIFTATPNNGYYFDGWYDENGALVATDSVYEIIVTTDTELTARFKQGVKDLELNEAPRTEDTIKVLAFGNSFSNDATTFIPEIAKADGKDIRVADCYIGGCSLERHCGNISNGTFDYSLYYRTISGKKTFSKVSMEQALKASDWDYVTIQQVSGNSGKIDTFEPYLKELVAYFKGICPDAEILFHSTWAYAQNSTHSAFENYNSSQSEMYEAIEDAYLEASQNYGFVRLIPTGEAIKRVRATKIGDNLNRDGYHLNDKGRVIAALTWYETFTGISALDTKVDLVNAIGTIGSTNGITIGITEEESLLMRTAAHEAAELFKKANETQLAIEAIGEVTEESGEAIEKANTLRTELGDDDLLPNLQTLIDANSAYDKLVSRVTIGDVTGDDKVDLEDVNVLAQYLAGWKIEVNGQALDADGDGAVNLKDLVLLAQFVAGWDVSLG